MKHRWILAAGLLAGAGAFSVFRPQADAPRADAGLVEPPARLRGAVVYQRGPDLYVTTLGSANPRLLVRNGSYPRWSPDGAQIAFVRGQRILTVTVEGTSETVRAEAGDARAVAWHPDGRSLLFTDGERIRVAPLDGGSIQTMAAGRTFLELDLAGGGTRLVVTVPDLGGIGYHVRAYNLETGEDWKLGNGCSASFSPDGSRISNLLNNHLQLAVREWPSGRELLRLDAPPGLKFDNHYWSNHPDWIASQSEGSAPDIFIHQLSANRSYRVTTSGDCSRGDLYVEEDQVTSILH